MYNLRTLRKWLPPGAALDVLLSLAVARSRLGYFPNLLRPTTLNEHIILGKLRFHGSIELARRLTDKQHFKDWLKAEGLEDLIVPTVGVYGGIEQIVTAKLGGNLAIKPTHASGKILIKHDFNGNFHPKELSLLQDWLSCDYYLLSREPNYFGLDKKILVEELLFTDQRMLPCDYKFFCGGGRVFLIQVDVGRFVEHRRSLFTREWQRLPYSLNYPASETSLDAPTVLQEMIEHAEHISRNFQFCRVDLYVAAGDRIKAGEITFFPGNGFEGFSPREGDAYCGSLFRKAVTDASLSQDGSD